MNGLNLALEFIKFRKDDSVVCTNKLEAYGFSIALKNKDKSAGFYVSDVEAQNQPRDHFPLFIKNKVDQAFQMLSIPSVKIGRLERLINNPDQLAALIACRENRRATA